MRQTSHSASSFTSNGTKDWTGIEPGPSLPEACFTLSTSPIHSKKSKKKTEQKIKCRKHNGRKNREVEKGEVIGRRWGKNAEIQI